MLKAIAAATLNRRSRPADVTARFGGEEFAMVLPNTPAAGARHDGEKLRQAVASLKIPHQSATVEKVVTLIFW